MLILSLIFTASLTLTQVSDTLDVATVTDSKNIALGSSVPIQRKNSAKLSKAGVISLAEALKTFSGVNVKDYGGLGGMKTVSIRSFGSQHTGIIYDGQVISNVQNGQVDIGRFNLDNVSSISLEICGVEDIFRPARLSGSVGVLSIESAKPTFNDHSTLVTAGLRQGSFDTWNPYINFQQRLGRKWSAVLWANYLYTDGNYPFILRNGNLVSTRRRSHSDVSAVNGEAAIYGDLRRGGRLNFRLSYYGSERGLPGSVVLYTENAPQRLWDRDMRVSALYDVSLGFEWKLKTSASYSNIWNRFVDYNSIYDPHLDDRYRQEEWNASIAALYQPFSHWDFSLAHDVAFNTLTASIPGCPYPERISTYTSLSGKYYSQRLTAVTSLLGIFAKEWAQSGNPSPDRFHISPSVSLSYALPRSIHIRASFKDSYRMPTFNDLYYPRVGSRTLKPEHAYQTNLGLTWEGIFGKHEVAVTADGYWNAVRNRIVAVPSMFIWSMRNVGRVRILGTDLSTSYKGQVCDWMGVHVSATYSYQYAVDVTNPSAKNYRHQIAYTPRNYGSVNSIVELPWFNFSYTLQAVGQRYSLTQNTLAYRIEPYADHSISINREFVLGKKHLWKLNLSAEGLNLSGANYEIIKFYPMPGIQYRLSIKITY